MQQVRNLKIYNLSARENGTTRVTEAEGGKLVKRPCN